MLIGTLLPSVAQTVQGAPDAAYSSSSASDSDDFAGTELDLDWLEIDYDKNGVVITVAPEIDAFLGLNKAELKSVLDTLINAFKTIVIEQIKSSWLEDNQTTPDGDPADVEGITLETVWEKALQGYIDDNYQGYSSDSGKYIDFFEDMMDSDEKVGELVDHVCNIISLAVSAGVIKASELPETDGLEEKLTEVLDNFVHKKISEFAEAAIKKYTDDAAAGNEHDQSSKIEVFAGHFIDAHFTEIIESYINHKAHSTAHGENVIDDLIDGYIDSLIKSGVDAYIAGTTDGGLNGFADEARSVITREISEYIDGLKKDYIDYKLGETWTHDDKFRDIIDSVLEEFAEDRVDNYFAYMSDTSATLAYDAVYELIEELVYTECANDVPNLTKDIYLASRGDVFAEYTLDVDTVQLVQSALQSLEAEHYAVFEAYDAEPVVREYLLNAENRAVLDEYIDGEKSSLEQRIASAFLAEYNTAAKLHEEIDSIIAAVMPMLDTPEYASHKEAIISEIAGSDTLFGEALAELFGMGASPNAGETTAEAAVREFETREDEMSAMLISKYAITRENLIKTPPELSYRELFEALNSISVISNRNGTACGGIIFKGGAVNKDNLISLIKDLPRLEEIAEMTPEEMFLEFAIAIDTAVGDAAFTVKVMLNPDEKYDKYYSKINGLAKFLLDQEYVNGSYENGTLTVDVLAPAITSKALTKVLKSTVIGEDLKERVYSLVIGDLAGAKDFFDGLTYEEARSLVAAVDFEGIIDEIEADATLSRYLAKLNEYFNVSEITNQQILDKLDSVVKPRFNKVKNKLSGYVDKIYDRLPDKLKDKTVVDLYKGITDGKALFELNGSFSVDLLSVQRELIELCPDEHDGKLVYVFDLVQKAIGRDTVGATLDLSLQIPNMAKITYMIGNTEQRVGFLPKGVNPQNFAGIDEYAGVAILRWVNADGVAITEMPVEDTTLHAVLEQDVTVAIDPADRAFVYDGSFHYLRVNVIYGANWQDVANTEVTVKWYLGEEATGTPIGNDSVLGVKSIGVATYSCVVTVANSYATETFVFDNTQTEPERKAITVTVTPPEVGSEILIDGEYTYINKTYSDSSEYTISASLDSALAENVTYQWYFIPEGETEAQAVVGATSSEHKVKNVAESGQYYAVISYIMDAHNAYTHTTDKVTVNIEPISIDASAVWNYNVFESDAPAGVYVIVADGNAHSVVNDTVLNKNISTLFTLENCTGTNAGAYNATATVKDTNYILSGGSSSTSLTWYIINEFDVLVKLNGAAPQDQSNIVIDTTYDKDTEHTVTIITGSFTGTSVIWEKYNGTDWIPVEELDGEYEVSFADAEESRYRWTVAYTENGYSQEISGEVAVKIAPKPISLDGLGWSGDTEFTYNGEAHTAPTLSGTVTDALDITLDYTVMLGGTEVSEIKKPGVYTVKATVSLVNVNSNYVLGTAEKEITVTVAKAAFSDAGIKWNYTTPFTYDGNEHTVAIVGYESFPNVQVKYAENSRNSATEIGKYTAVFSAFVVVDGGVEYPLTDYYSVSASESSSFKPSLEWEIVSVPTPVDKTEHEWNKDGTYVKVTDTEAFLSDYNMSVSKVTGYDIITLPDGRRMKVIDAYNIIFTDENGNKPAYDSNNVFTVTFKTPTGYDATELEIVYIDESAAASHALIASTLSQDKKSIDFDVKHFSIYAVAIEVEDSPVVPPAPPTPPTPPEPPTDEPDPSDFDWRIIALIILAIILILLIIFIASKVKRGSHRKYEEMEETIELYDDLAAASWSNSPIVYVNGREPDSVLIEEAPIKKKPIGDRAKMTITESAFSSKKGGARVEKTNAKGVSRPAVTEIHTAKNGSRIIGGDVPVTEADSYGITRIRDGAVPKSVRLSGKQDARSSSIQVEERYESRPAAIAARESDDFVITKIDGRAPRGGAIGRSSEKLAEAQPKARLVVNETHEPVGSTSAIEDAPVRRAGNPVITNTAAASKSASAIAVSSPSGNKPGDNLVVTETPAEKSKAPRKARLVTGVATVAGVAAAGITANDLADDKNSNSGLVVTETPAVPTSRSRAAKINTPNVITSTDDGMIHISENGADASTADQATKLVVNEVSDGKRGSKFVVSAAPVAAAAAEQELPDEDVGYTDVNDVPVTITAGELEDEAPSDNVDVSASYETLVTNESESIVAAGAAASVAEAVSVSDGGELTPNSDADSISETSAEEIPVEEEPVAPILPIEEVEPVAEVEPDVEEVVPISEVEPIAEVEPAVEEVAPIAEVEPTVEEVAPIAEVEPPVEEVAEQAQAIVGAAAIGAAVAAADVSDSEEVTDGNAEAAETPEEVDESTDETTEQEEISAEEIDAADESDSESDESEASDVQEPVPETEPVNNQEKTDKKMAFEPQLSIPMSAYTAADAPIESVADTPDTAEPISTEPDAEHSGSDTDTQEAQDDSAFTAPIESAEVSDTDKEAAEESVVSTEEKAELAGRIVKESGPKDAVRLESRSAGKKPLNGNSENTGKIGLSGEKKPVRSENESIKLKGDSEN